MSRKRPRANLVRNAGLHVAEARYWDCPFKILVDSREQTPWTFEGITANAEDGGGMVRVETVVGGIPEGDYSIEYHTGIVVERKSKADIWSTIAQGRDRFRAELARIQERREIGFVIVEAEWSEVMEQPGFCHLNPKSLNRTIDSLMLDYPKVHWLFMPTRQHAERKAFWLLYRHWLKKTTTQAQGRNP